VCYLFNKIKLMLSRIFKWYNQGLERYTRNACSLYSLFMIVQLQWWINFSNEYIVKACHEAEKDKAWYETWWAYFDKVYKWFVWKIYTIFNIEVKVITVDILSDEFEALYDKKYAFGLWLMYTGSLYRSLRADWKIELHEVTDIDLDNYYKGWHNHVFTKAKESMHTWIILDSLKWISGKPILMSLETLRASVRAWIYYRNARTLYMKDRLLDKHLKYYQKGIKIDDIENLSKKEQQAIARASKLRIFKK